MDLNTQYCQVADSPKIYVQFQCFLYKNSSRILVEFDTLILNYLQKCKGQNRQKIIKKNKDGGITLRNVKTHYKLVVDQTLWCKHKDIKQTNGTGEKSRNNPSHIRALV